MGDRIKFGPEWLRNFSREGSAGSNNSQNAGGGAGGVNSGPVNSSNNATSGGNAREHTAHGLNNLNNAQGNPAGNFSYSALVANSHQYVGGGHAGGPNSYSALVAGNSSNNSYGSGNHGSNSYSASAANTTNSSYGGHGNVNPYNPSVTTSTSNAYGGTNQGAGSYSTPAVTSISNPYGAGGQNTYNTTANTNMGGGTSSAFPGGNHGGNSSCSSTNNAGTRVHLANLRYGREEMLALYDDEDIDPPEELRQFTILYNTRRKPPIALSSHFEEDANRENVRPVQTQSAPSTGHGVGRGAAGTRGRGASFNSVRSNPGRTTYRSNSVRPGFPERPAEDVYDLTSLPYRPWNSSATNRSTSPNRNGMEPQPATAEWVPKRRWVPSSTNWRREQKREEGDEWRSPESARQRQPEKWDRERGERPERGERSERGDRRERPERGTWGGRRAWSGDAPGDENYPEWAMDNSETCGGVFDSSGAFHGYSNDDSNLPKTPSEANPLTRSHTQGSFSRSKVTDEGSEEWWASEKSKKLSPKRFEGTQPPPPTSEQSSTTHTTANARATPSASFHSTAPPSFPLDSWGMMNKMTANSSKENMPATGETRKAQQQAKQPGEKTFDALMRSDINVEEASDERGNFQSVMIASNNSLRQRHQNIVSNASDVVGPNAAVTSSLMCDADVQDTPDLMNLEYYENRGSLDPHNVAAHQQHMANLGMRMAIPNPQNVMVMNRAGFNVANPQVVPVTMPMMSTVMSSSQVPMSRYASPAMVNVQRESLFLSEDNAAMSHQMGQPSQMQQANIFPLHGHGIGPDQPTGPPYASSLYNMRPPPPMAPQGADEWYYEDPEKNIQGPFSPKEMYGWFQAGFFTSTLMVRRACDSHMRPLGSFGPVPFADDAIPFPPQGPRDNSALGGTQQSLLGDVLRPNRRDALELEFGSFGNEFLAPAFNKLAIDSLWSSPPDHKTNEIWNRDAASHAQEESKDIDDQWESAKRKSEMGIPADIKNEMKTEEQILAQIRASQKMQQNLQFISKEQQKLQAVLGKKDDLHSQTRLVIPDLAELERLMQKESLNAAAAAANEKMDSQAAAQDKSKDNAPAKQAQSVAKIDKSKPVKNEDKSKQAQSVPTKSKKKGKDDKKDDSSDSKESEKRSQESSPSKSKKEDKLSKKEIEKEKKEWIKEGFTIVKGTEKGSSKDSKKKNEETKAAEEAERKRKEEDKLTAEEEKRRKHVEATKKQQDLDHQQHQARHLDAVTKKAPWSAVANQGQTVSRDGLTLAEIQRLEREKKLEQMKEQQAMMQIIAQQQQAALAREQEMQAGLAWAKKKGANTNMLEQSLAEIQAEARKQAAAAAAVAAVAAQVIEEVQPAPQPVNIAPWGNPMNGGGFWDTERLNQLNQKQPAEKPQEVPKPVEPKPKKKQQQQVVVPKKEVSPVVEFDSWCTNVLNQFSSKVDVPAFVGFLKDIESPYEIKEYVKCYLGESKDSNDFARQFLERRSKLLRAGTVTPVDDLCSPAAAINPRTISGSDYQEVKGKGKKSKKNKMLKVDARILGFSVTASEDRINVGDIDTA